MILISRCSDKNSLNVLDTFEKNKQREENKKKFLLIIKLL
jgi:hypothetical protein